MWKAIQGEGWSRGRFYWNLEKNIDVIGVKKFSRLDECRNIQNVDQIFCKWPLPGVVFFKNFLIYYEHKAAVCGILLSLFLQTKTVFLLSPCASLATSFGLMNCRKIGVFNHRLYLESEEVECPDFLPTVW